MSDIKKKVEEAINSSGYPLELFTGSKLSEMGEIVWYNEYFFDYDLQLARSIDLFVPAFPKKKVLLKSDLFSRIAIECKKSPDTAWVFLEADEPVMEDFMGQFVDFTQILNNQYSVRHLLWNIDENFNLHYSPTEPAKLAKNFQVVKIGDKDLFDPIGKASKRKDTIFEAINQVTKFICYQIKNEEKRCLVKWHKSSKIEPNFHIYFPVIVFDGPMYNGVLEGDKIKLNEIDHVLLQHNYQPIYSDKPLPFYIDIVRKEKLLDLIQLLQKDVENILNQISKGKNSIEKNAHGLYVPDSRLKQSLSR